MRRQLDFRAGLLLLLVAAWAPAQSLDGAGPFEPRAAASGQPRGRPRVVLDRFDFPKQLPEAAHLERHLKQVLRREARRADWGAGRNNRIEYRFKVEALEVRLHGDVLSVRCSAFGRLPSNKMARSSIAFGGKPAERRKLLERVLEIVARGVITRLAEIERIRRGVASNE